MYCSLQTMPSPAHDAAARDDVEALETLLEAEPSLIGAWDQLPLPKQVMGQPLHSACYVGSLRPVPW